MTTQPKIFVSIAAYCDPILPRTLDECLATARHPENLRFGICWQYDARQDVELNRFKTDRRFRFLDFPYRESEGGPWARSRAQTLWDGEAYLLQVDSHMAFAPCWDDILIRMMRALPADKPLITMNAPLFKLNSKDEICRQTNCGIRTTRLTHWTGSEGWAPWFDWGVHNEKRPGRSRFISGGFVFTTGSWAEEVRSDPEQYYWGEEFALTLRSYTHGYDLFLPDTIVAWHMLHQEAPPRRHWEHGEAVVQAKRRVAFERLRKLAYSDDAQEQDGLGAYGLGAARERRDYERYAGMDLARKRAHPDVFSGRNPDPITIKTDDDWAACLTSEAYLAQTAPEDASRRPSN